MWRTRPAYLTFSLSVSKRMIVGHSHRRTRTAVRTVGAYAAITLVPVLALGLALSINYRNDAQRRGLIRGRSEAGLLATTVAEPALDGQPLAGGLSTAQVAELDRSLKQATIDNRILRFRIRNLSAQVVYSFDRSGFNDIPDQAADQAARGRTVARLTTINTDANDTGPRGARAIEVYLPISAGAAAPRMGVLEVYVPYARIAKDVTAGLKTMYIDLAMGLTLLWLTLLGISISVSRRLRRQVRLNAHAAEHDPLTDLPNRQLFHRRAQEAVDAARRHGWPTAIAIIDLDRFKEINDTLGHHNGDEVLLRIGQRLAAEIGPADLIARLGGDEFGIIFEDPEDPAASLERLRLTIADHLEVTNLPLSIEASIGYVVAPADGTDANQLIQRADVAMYLAKARHLGVVRYDHAQDHYDPANLALVGEFRSAMDAGQLVLHYQPKLSLSDGSVRGVEALVRWQHPILGLLGPDRFLPLLEQTEHMDRLTAWVLSRALSDMADLGPEVRVGVNISARNLGRADFGRQVIDLLALHRVLPRRLTIEITETALLTDPERAAVLLAELAEAGVRISLDDFGCGQTSFGYLSTLPIHELKIDKSFVSGVGVRPADAAIVRSIIELGHNLNLGVVAEGVETGDTLAWLRAVACDEAQGFLIARPMPADRLRTWLASAECVCWTHVRHAIV